MSPVGHGARRQRGFALLVVLWSMPLLALVGTHVTATGRVEAQLAGNLRQAAVAEAAADGATYEAIFHLLDTAPRRWLPDGLPREIALPGGGLAVVTVRSEAGKVNPNIATMGLWKALLGQLGADPAAAASLAAAILDWRTIGPRPRPGGAKEPQYRAAGRDYAPPGRPFESIEELGLVLGMTPALADRLAPYLSLYQNGAPDPRMADPLVLRAMADAADVGQDAELDAEADPATVVLITAAVTLPGRARFTRQAHIRIGLGTRGRRWQVLTWRAVAA